MGFIQNDKGSYKKFILIKFVSQIFMILNEYFKIDKTFQVIDRKTCYVIVLMR